MKPRWSPRARCDLLQIRQFIAKDDRRAAARWLERLEDRVLRAAELPRAGRAVPEFRNEDIREVFAGTYRIIYKVEGDAILVLTVLEGHRLLRVEELEPSDR